MDTLNIPISKFKFSLAVIGSLGGIITILTVDHEANDSFAGWSILLLCVVLLLGSLYRMLQAGPELVLDDTGLTYRHLKVGTISWRDIIFAKPFEFQGMRFVFIWVRNPEDYLKGLSPLRRWLMGARKSQEPKPFRISVNGLKISTKQLVEEILKRATATQI
ncbi:hypothetical protein SAMN05216271_2687 [Halopseudomonas sabulinigri]|uniref:PH domain-containing protein n=1 Tax=Halopseudomonas sabulinigri TaxID=472181 RepID=A0A1H1UWP7_9GAMM|nr:STM3941 family protein [Halopseudomonas sabulinigri]SDS76952.1 hypothetical protein SAMN05216271_2687 [Halopseudomonas sabulinigri]